MNYNDVRRYEHDIAYAESNRQVQAETHKNRDFSLLTFRPTSQNGLLLHLKPIIYVTTLIWNAFK